MTIIAILSVGEFVVNRDVPRCQHLPSSAGRGLELAAPAPTQCEIVSKTPQQRCPQNRRKLARSIARNLADQMMWRVPNHFLSPV